MVVRDRVEYALPFGPLGRLVAPLSRPPPARRRSSSSAAERSTRSSLRARPSTLDPRLFPHDDSHPLVPPRPARPKTTRPSPRRPGRRSRRAAVRPRRPLRERSERRAPRASASSAKASKVSAAGRSPPSAPASCSGPGPASRALPALVAETGASAVYANAEIGPYRSARPGSRRRARGDRGRGCVLFPDALLVEPDALTTAAGDAVHGLLAVLAQVAGGGKARIPAARPPRRRLSAASGFGRPWNACRPAFPSDRSLNSAPGRGNRGPRDVPFSGFVSGAARGATPATATSRPARRPRGSRLTSTSERYRPRTILAAAERSDRPERARGVEEDSSSSSRGASSFTTSSSTSRRVATESFRREFRDFPWSSDESTFSAWRAGAHRFSLVDARR